MDVLNERNNQDKKMSSYEKMMIFSELTGLEEVPSLDDLFGAYEAATGKDILDLIFDMDNGQETAERNESATEPAEPEEAEDTELKELLNFLFFN